MENGNYQMDKWEIQFVDIFTTLMSIRGKVIVLGLQELVLAQHDN